MWILHYPDSYGFYGPFDTQEAAKAWAMGYSNYGWYVIQLTDPKVMER
jgi:hypothetical protein